MDPIKQLVDTAEYRKWGREFCSELANKQCPASSRHAEPANVPPVSKAIRKIGRLIDDRWGRRGVDVYAQICHEPPVLNCNRIGAFDV